MSVKEAIVRYEEFYMDRYGKKPSEFLINRFCEVNNLNLEEQEEVAEMEQAEYTPCSALQDITTTATDGTIEGQSNRITELLKILERYKDKLSPDDVAKLQEIEMEMEGANIGSGVEGAK